MFTGRVRGEIWATKRHETLAGLKLLLVEPLALAERGEKGVPPMGLVVAADTVDAGVGDEVIVAYGRAGRVAIERGQDIAVEAAIVGVVDARSGAELH